ncbi:hypothetical protein Pan153_50270 [Gimesia panareensis]|uniref:Uncharacterized protein n=1 Tax=Gimesia panareensis TaxID=2527978 RepID=A0A518FVH6_9PLAN|nr:hypothetical protein [Gimesia panareensis]QDV20352.1 hypothetical protein Pan153_50270 [Gimesia panareensis]
MIESETRTNLKHNELNRASLICLLMLSLMVGLRCGLAVAGYRSWNGILTAFLVIGILTILVHLQARLTAGQGLLQLWKRCSRPAPLDRNLTFIDGSLIFIYVMGINAYCIYLAILD